MRLDGDGTDFRVPEPGSLALDIFLSRYEQAIDHSLNPDQAQAIRHDHGPLFITAGPGSGKSEVIVAHALKLVLVDGVHPKSIFLTTFTEKAARSLQDRVADRLARMEYDTSLDDLRVGTLHSLCDQIMREYRYLPYADFRLLDEMEQHLFVYANCEWIDAAPADFWSRFRYLHPMASGQYGPNKWQKTGTLVSLFNRVADEEVDLHRLNKSKNSAIRELAEAVSEYESALEEKHRSDFSRLQVHFLSFLGHPLGRKFLDGDPEKGLPPLRHVLVDEYQDTNPIQETIYFSLARSTRGNITIVGDDDQALYRFRGSTVECMLRFPDVCRREYGKLPKTIQLRVNYRSLPEITHWAEGMLASAPAMRLPGARTARDRMDNHRASVGDFSPVLRIEGTSHDNAGERVAQVIRSMIERKQVGDPSQIAVLLKSTRESPHNAGPVVSALRALRVPVYNPRSKAFLDAEEVQGMLGTLIEILDRARHVGGTLRGFVRNSIDAWTSAYARLGREHPELKSYVKTVHVALERQRGGVFLNVTLRDLFYRILSRPPFQGWQEDPERTHRLGQLSRVLEAFASVEGSDSLRTSRTEPGRFSHGWLRGRFYPRLVGFLHQARLDDPEDLDYEIVPGRVQVMTVHQAKGLEFPVVFVDSLNLKPRERDATYVLEDELMPFSRNKRKLLSPHARAEQDVARLFYVAYTRAQNALILFGPSSHFSGGFVALGAC